jgi:RNA methyltransferase, TrmH family
MNESEPIRSRENKRLVELRKVRDGRDRTRIFIEGKRLADEALRSPLVLEECFFDAERIDGPLLEGLGERGVTFHPVASQIFPSIADTDSSQGIILTAKRPNYLMSDITAAGNTMVVYLSEINNPSNLGAICRTAEAAGVAGVVVSRGSADPYSAKALRASMGSAFRLKLVESVSLAEAVEWARSQRISSVALDVAAEKRYTDADRSTGKLVVFGSEAHGLSDADLELIDEKVVIPMENGVESLNLAVAVGIVLFEFRRPNF